MSAAIDAVDSVLTHAGTAEAPVVPVGVETEGVVVDPDGDDGVDAVVALNAEKNVYCAVGAGVPSGGAA
jgi:hypothetical protein